MGDDEDDHAVDAFYEKLMNKKKLFHSSTQCEITMTQHRITKRRDVNANGVNGCEISSWDSIPTFTINVHQLFA